MQRCPSPPPILSRQNAECEVSLDFQEAYNLLVDPKNVKNGMQLQLYLNELGLESWQDLELIAEDSWKALSDFLKEVPKKKFCKAVGH